MKPILRHSMTVVLLTCFCLPAWATGSTYIGLGKATCSDYLDVLNSNAKDASAYALAVDSWTMGFMSGVNLFVREAKKIDLLAQIKGDDVSRFLKKYCADKRNSSKNIKDASFVLIDLLEADATLR